MWTEITEEWKVKAAELIGMIDAGEKVMFLNPEADNDFHGLLCNKYLSCGEEFGVISAQYYQDYLHISFCFQGDLPECEREITKEMIQKLLASQKCSVRFWLRKENTIAIELLKQMYHTEPDYASREMSISKEEFNNWKVPQLSNEYKLKDFQAEHHMEYLDFLECNMRHVNEPGTHPYWSNSENLLKYFAERNYQKAFFALWKSNEVVGLCYMDGEEIDTLAISEKERGKKLGYYLLVRALQQAFSCSCSSIRLYVVDGNENAYRFYQHCGMRCSAHSTRVKIDLPLQN